MALLEVYSNMKRVSGHPSRGRCLVTLAIDHSYFNRNVQHIIHSGESLSYNYNTITQLSLCEMCVVIDKLCTIHVSYMLLTSKNPDSKQKLM